ncbi:MAG: SRPBCC domain-containing protein [Spirosomataceae bacterium]
MEQKTKIEAENDKQELLITREFDLPLALLFKAYITPEIIEQWMGTKVLKLENKKHGSWQFETTDPKGNKHVFHGVIHEFSPNQKITRTFEMVGTSFPVQLEFLVFEHLTNDTSKLTIHIVYKSVADRDRILQLPFRQGLNMAHHRLQEVMNKHKKHANDYAKPKS